MWGTTGGPRHERDHGASTAALGGPSKPVTIAGLRASPTTRVRNRHCPKCQGAARAQWLADRQAELLPVPYYRIVSTLPASIAAVKFQNKSAVYAILFTEAID